VPGGWEGDHRAAAKPSAASLPDSGRSPPASGRRRGGPPVAGNVTGGTDRRAKDFMLSVQVQQPEGPGRPGQQDWQGGHRDCHVRGMNVRPGRSLPDSGRSPPVLRSPKSRLGGVRFVCGDGTTLPVVVARQQSRKTSCPTSWEVAVSPIPVGNGRRTISEGLSYARLSIGKGHWRAGSTAGWTTTCERWREPASSPHRVRENESPAPATSGHSSCRADPWQRLGAT
jgi:hypothetical protein